MKKVFEKPGSSHFWVIFYIKRSLELLQLTSKDVLFVSLFPCLCAWRKKNQNGTCIFLFEISLIKQSRDMVG